MFSFVNKFTPRDLIALISIIAVLFYKVAGHNGGFDALVSLIIGYYFGRRDDATVTVLPK